MSCRFSECKTWYYRYIPHEPNHIIIHYPDFRSPQLPSTPPLGLPACTAPGGLWVHCQWPSLSAGSSAPHLPAGSADRSQVSGSCFNHEKGISEYLYSIYSTMLYQYIIVYHNISIQYIYKMFGISIPKSKEGRPLAHGLIGLMAGWWRLVAAPNAVADGGHIVSCCDGGSLCPLLKAYSKTPTSPTRHWAQGKVSSCIGFSKDVEVGALVLLELSKELLQEPDHGTGDPMCRLKRRSVQTCVLSFKDLQTPGSATIPLNAGKSK